MGRRIPRVHLRILFGSDLRCFSAMFFVLFCLLVYLGTWQLFRLDWKLNLIEKIENNIKHPPVPFEDLIQHIHNDYEDIEYRKVQLKGKIEQSNRLRLVSKMYGGAQGYHLLVPFKLNSGSLVLVNLGWVPNRVDVQDVYIPDSEVILTGMVLKGYKNSSFTPLNNYSTNELFFVDTKEVSKTYNWINLWPFYVSKIENHAAFREYPVIDKPNISLRNFHLQYAITWYLLALICVCIFVLYVKKYIYK